MIFILDLQDKVQNSEKNAMPCGNASSGYIGTCVGTSKYSLPHFLGLLAVSVAKSDNSICHSDLILIYASLTEQALWKWQLHSRENDSLRSQAYEYSDHIKIYSWYPLVMNFSQGQIIANINSTIFNLKFRIYYLLVNLCESNQV